MRTEKRTLKADWGEYFISYGASFMMKIEAHLPGLSFPRKRESRMLADVWLLWIPTAVGMTTRRVISQK